jgi:hypothetical protein
MIDAGTMIAVFIASPLDDIAIAAFNHRGIIRELMNIMLVKI